MNDISLILSSHHGDQVVPYNSEDSITFVLGLIVNDIHITIDSLSDEDRAELHSDDYRESEHQARAAMLELSDFFVLILHDPTQAVRDMFTAEQQLEQSDDYTLYLPVRTITIHTAEVPT